MDNHKSGLAALPLIIIVLVLIGAGAYWYSRNTATPSVAKPPATTAPPGFTPPTTPPPSTSDVEQKVIDWDTQNEGNFTGYYIKTEHREENAAPYTCDSFVLLNKDDVIAKYFKKEYDWDLNEIYIDLSKVSLVDKNKIINSTINNPTGLVLKKKIEPGKDAPDCYSFFEILSVK